MSEVFWGRLTQILDAFVMLVVHARMTHLHERPDAAHDRRFTKYDRAHELGTYDAMKRKQNFLDLKPRDFPLVPKKQTPRRFTVPNESIDLDNDFNAELDDDFYQPFDSPPSPDHRTVRVNHDEVINDGLDDDIEALQFAEIRETPLADAEQNHETDSNDNQLESDAGEEFEGDDDAE
jgi:hypothetical protein